MKQRIKLKLSEDIMFCHKCICSHCSYGMNCSYCDTWLNRHIIIAEGCSGCIENNICPLTEMLGNGAMKLRDFLKNKDEIGIENFFKEDFYVWYK